MSSDIRPYTHYDILLLPRQNLSGLSKDDTKAAYRRALLLHHPDKASSAGTKTALRTPQKVASNPQYSVDEIVVAFDTLSDPTRRAEYDKSLERENAGWIQVTGRKEAHTGVETYDLEDLVYDVSKNTWSRTCRCGDEQGYIVAEPDLERESQHGEVYVGCRGCSLFIKVLFAAEET